ncbi:9994_t:CDS:10 [Racocetra persica]|uniref:9994_t:CDS:1 n=1 Tax=Racocetra persica TaxID=160502 RepID=A0ACA9KGS1_9GLOM|nr:9994_t:CDS:10 [Racocetra persica]
MSAEESTEDFEECETNTRTTFSLAEESTEDFEECEDNTRTTFSLGLESNNCVDLSLEVSENIRESLGLELGIVKDNSCMGSKVSEVNTGSIFGLELDSIDPEVSEDNFEPILRLELELAKDKGGLDLEVRENSKDLVKNNSSVNSDLELAESRSNIASDFGSGSVYSLSFEKDLSNAIQKIKHEKNIASSDASQLLNDRLCGIFWMTGDQIMLWTHYLDIILHDNTSRTNKYNYPLSLFILVDNDRKSWLGAQVFINDKIQKSYEWILQQTLNATGLEPQLKNKLGSADYKAFINDFWKMCNVLYVNIFEQRFQTLLDIYPNANKYLHDLIYTTCYSWAYAFTSRIFIVANVVEALDSQIQQKAMNKSFIAWKYKSTIYQQLFINKVDLVSSEPFVEASSKGFKRFQSDNLQETYPIPKYYNNMQESQIYQHIYKKLYYSQLIEYFKKALNYLLEDNNQKALDDIILSYISKKEANQKTDMQPNQKVLKENTGLNCEIRLSNGHIYNVDNIKDLIKHRGKGRPLNKQIKDYNEKNKVDSQKQSNNDIIDNDNSGSCKCGLYYKTGHYAPKCLTKNSEC